MDADRLYAYIESVRNAPFRWGQHDCLGFCNSAVRAARGHGFADDWVGGYSTELGAAARHRKLLLLLGFSGIVEAVDSRLERYKARVPPRGCVIARPCDGVLGHCFGIVVSDRAAFVGEAGLNMLRLDPEDLFWRI